MYQCKICPKKISGQKKSNLVSHLFAVHREVHDEHILEKNDSAANEMQLKLIQCMVEKVTINGRPFASLNDSGYKKSIQDKLELLEKSGCRINLSDKKYRQIKEYISSTSNKIKEKIRTEVEGRNISLMLDVATKNNKSILGINLRFIFEEKIIERCIGMVPISERHTSQNLAIKVKECIDKFGIKLKQVKSITTDNAGNVIGIVDYIDEELFCAIEEEAAVDEMSLTLLGTSNTVDEIIPTENIDDAVNEDEIRDLARQILIDDAFAEYLDDSDEYADLLKKVIDDFPHHFNENTVNVRCGAHTLQLIVRGALKKSNVHSLVTVCRKVAITLRQETYVREARKLNYQYSLPHLNVETRWDYDYKMLDDILKCKQVVDHFASKERIFKIVKEKWTIIEETVKLLKMFFVTTKQLQLVDFTLSDFYGYLLVLKENLIKYLDNVPQITNLATFLQTELNTRLPLLIKNPLMVCAIFLDRRYSTELTNDEKTLAIKTLIKLWEDIRSGHFHSNSDNANVNNNENESFEFEDNASVLESYFKSKGVDSVVPDSSETGEPNYSLSNSQMDYLLQNFDEKMKRQPPSTKVLEFWSKNKKTFPEIYILSTIINAVPPTQATTERSFSSLNFIYDDRRTNLSLVLLEQILLIRLNKDLAETIFDEDLKSMKNKK